MDNEKKYLLIEDTEVMNSGYSVLLSELLKKREIFEDCVPIFWRSPCWESQKNGEPILTNMPTYNKHKRKGQIFQSYSYKEWSSANYEECKQITTALLDNTIMKSSRISLKELSKIRYMNTSIGLACTSTCLRILPESNVSGNAQYDFIFHILLRLICSIQYFIRSKLVESIKFFLPSETVYQSYTLVEFFIQHDVTIPILYSSDSPLWITKKHLNSPTGRSPRNLARREAFKLNHSPEDMKQWMQRYQKNSPVNNAITEQKDTVHTLGINLARKAQVNYAYSPKHIFKHNQEKNLQLVFFLHAITDGPYQHGYSGKLTPFHFYQNLIEAINQAIGDQTSLKRKDIILTFKLHPNLMHGSNSIYQSHQQRSANEFNTTTELVFNLLTLSQNLGFSTYLLSPHIPNKYLMAHPGYICVTHHGTIAAESLAFAAPVITTSLAYLPDKLLINESLVLRANESKQLINDLQSILTNSQGLSRRFNKENLPDISAALGQQSNYFKELMSDLCRRENCSISNLDKHIYEKAKSWPYFFSLDPSATDHTLHENLYQRIVRSFRARST